MNDTLNPNEPLDFCRVKNINEKGYGFLKSLYYPVDIFFHFTRIKKEVFLNKLKNLQRGDFFLFFTSVKAEGDKRKVDKLWYAMDEVPGVLLPGFADRVTLEFESGKMNIYDLLFAVEELKKLNMLGDELMKRIMKAGRIASIPTVLLPVLSPEEKEEFKKVLELEKYKDADKKPFWYDEIAGS